MTHFPHQRDFTRVPVHLEVEIQTAGMKLNSTETRDLSMTGLFVQASGRFSANEECQVTLFLRGAAEETRLTIRGKIVRVEKTGLAIQFLEMGPEEFGHLRNLVLYNSADIHQTEGEMKTHLGLKRV
jgi:PilZ domain